MAKSLANRKKQTLINNEYYNMQQKFDTLYNIVTKVETSTSYLI